MPFFPNAIFCFILKMSAVEKSDNIFNNTTTIFFNKGEQDLKIKLKIKINKSINENVNIDKYNISINK